MAYCVVFIMLELMRLRLGPNSFFYKDQQALKQNISIGEPEPGGERKTCKGYASRDNHITRQCAELKTELNCIM